jgi:DTW domain-containing protein YfiP
MKAFHHETLIEASEKKIQCWKDEVLKNKRCFRCWLRKNDCFCKELDGKERKYNSFWEELRKSTNLDFEVLIYYHPHELGRSANTAHVAETLFRPISKSLVYGNVLEEDQFWSQLIDESRNENTLTCILYPGQKSVPLSQWVNEHFMPSNSSQSISPRNSNTKHIRVVVLDGTYPCASRIAKYLESYQQQMHLPSRTFQFVSLELENDPNSDYCRSAVAGVMYQPTKEKICSYQAIAITLKDMFLQLAPDQKETIFYFFQEMMNDLHDWIAFIVKKKIKQGKPTSIKSIKGVDNSLSEDIKKKIVRDSF